MRNWCSKAVLKGYGLRSVVWLDTDDGVADVIRKAEDTRSVLDYQPSVASPRNNAEVAESSFKEKDNDHPYCNTTTKKSSRNEEAVGVTGSNLSEIKEHISRISGLRSAPVMPIAASREEIPGSDLSWR